jgi:hypothetical protein
MSTSYDDAVEFAWARFEQELAATLGELDCSLCITVEAVTTGDGAAPYVQFLGGDGELCAEVSSNAYLDESCQLDTVQTEALRSLGWVQEPGENWAIDVVPAQAGWLASVAVGTLRHVLGVEHPEFLDWPRSAATVSTEPVSATEIGLPADADALRGLVDAVVRDVSGHEVVRDEDGDVVLWRGDNLLWIRVAEQTPTVRIFSYLACGVASRTQARLEADVLNRRYRHLKFHVIDRTLQAEIDVPAMPFVAAHLRAMIDLAAEVVEELTPDVALRTRGRTIHEQSPHGRADSA